MPDIRLIAAGIGVGVLLVFAFAFSLGYRLGKGRAKNVKSLSDGQYYIFKTYWGSGGKHYFVLSRFVGMYTAEDLATYVCDDHYYSAKQLYLYRDGSAITVCKGKFSRKEDDMVAVMM